MIRTNWLLQAALLAIVLCFSTFAVAQEEGEATETPQPPDTEQTDGLVFSAPVIVDGEELFRLRGSSALPASERVADVAERIVEIARSSENETVTTELTQSEWGLIIRAEGRDITLVTQADADMEQMDLSVVARLQAQAIEEAIVRYRGDRTDEARVSSAFEALAWTFGFALFALLLFWIRRL